MTQVPQCFGKHWSNTATECRGGLDPSYVNPTNGSNRRDPCRWFQACASRTQAASLGQTQQQVPTQLVPVNRLANPPAVVPVQTGPGQPVQIQRPVHPYYQQPQQYAPQPTQYVGQMAPPYQAYYGAPFVPVPMQQPGMQVHGYLSIPEPVRDDIHWFWRLMGNAIRAMFKAATHESSHFFDHNTFNRPQPPQLPPAPPTP